MKKLLFLGALFGAGMLIWAAVTPSNKEDTIRMIKEEADRQGRTIDEDALSKKLDSFTSEQLAIFHEYVRNIIARTPQTGYWMEKLRASMEIDKKFWKDYQGIIFGT